MKTCIASYGRPERVLTKRIVPSAYVVVPESQKDRYALNYDNVYGIPDNEDGSASKKRNSILNRFDDDVFLLDDDILRIERYGGGELAGLERFAENAFDMCHDLGAGLWGFNITNDYMKIHDYQPISLTKQVFWCVGIVKDDIRYDERLSHGEDLDFWLQKLDRYRRVLRFNLYMPITSSSKDGGITNRENMLSSFDKLTMKWGKDIVRIKDREKCILGVNVPIKGV